MIAGELELQLYANVARITQDMARVESTVHGSMARIERAAQSAMNALGAITAGLSVAAFASMIQGAIDAADGLGKLSQRTGLTTEALSQLRYAASLADISHEGLSNSVRKLNVSIAQGLAGDKEKIALFRQLNITQSDLGRGTEAVMLKMADAYATSRDGAGKTAVSLELLGKTGDEMIPFLNAGSGAIREVMREADRLGLTIGPEFAARAEVFNDSMTRMRAGSQSLAIALATDLIEGLSKSAAEMARVTIEGGKLAGMVAGLKVLLRGDDQHQNNVRMVELTEKLWREENRLLQLRSGKAGKEHVATQEALVRGVREQLATTQTYRAELEQQAVSATKAADAIRKAREEGKELQASNAAAAAAASAAAKEAERARAKEQQERMKYGRAQVIAQYEAMKDGWAAEEKAAKDALVIAQERQKQRNDEAKQIEEYRRAEAEAQVAAGKAAAQQLADIQFETAALGMTNAERAKAIALRTLEQGGLDRSTQKYRDLAVAIAEAVEQREATREAIAMWESIDRTAHETFTNIFEGGTNVFKKLGQTLKAAVLDLLYQMTVRKWIISIGTSFGLPGAALAAPSMGGAGSLLGNLGGLFGGGGSGIAGGLMNGLSAWGSGGSVMGMMSNPGLYTMAEMAGALGPIAAGLAAVFAIAQQFKGETRSGGQYDFGRLIAGPSGGELGGGTAGQMAQATADTINATLKALGSSSFLTSFMTGMESSERGKGFAYAGGVLNTGTAFGQGWGAAFAQDGYMNRRGDMTAEQAVAAFSEELKQATLQAIAAATDVPESVMRLVRGKDFDAMATAELDAVLTQINAVVTSVTTLDAALVNLPFVTLTERTFDLKSALIEAAGGVEALVGKLNFVFERFYSEEEQRAQTVSNIQRVLAAAGGQFSEAEILGASRDQFRQMLDYWGGRADPFGQQLFNGLLDVAQAFDALHPVVEQAGDVIVDVVETVRDVIDDAYRALEQAAQRERSALEAQRQAAQQQATEIAGIVRLTQAATRQLYGQVESTRLMGGRRGAAFIAQALGTASSTGYLPESAALDAAIQAAMGGLGRPGQSTLDADFERLVLAGQLRALEEIAGPQLTEAERAVRVAEDQLQRMDQELQYWRDAIAIAQGTLDASLTWGDALGRMAAAFEKQFGGTASMASGIGGGGAVFGAPMAGGGGAVFGAGDSAQGLRYALTSMGIPVPMYHSGTAYVPSEQLALLQQGERVLTPAQNAGYVGNAEVVGALGRIEARLAAVERHSEATAQATNGRGGAPMRVRETPAA